MKLSGLEKQALREQLMRNALVAEQKQEELAQEQAADEAFRQEVIAWMVEDFNLDATELEATLSVVELEHRKLKLNVPEHTAIAFQLTRADEGFAIRDDRFDVGGAEGGYSRYAYGLGNALAAASEEYQEGERRQAEEARREAERQAKRELRERESAERGRYYLDMLSDHPILRPILDILNAFLSEREQFAADLENAEEWAAHTEARYEEKLEQAQYDAKRYASERDDLQRDLYDARDELDAERRKRGRGW